MVEIILVFLYPGCAEFEITVACWQIAESDDYDVITIAYGYEPIRTNSGFTMIPDKLVSEIKITEEIIGIIIPGGSLLDLRVELQEVIQKINDKNKLLAAICAGPQYFAATGVIGSRAYTTSRTPEIYKELNESDPFDWNNYQDKRVVVDRNLITAQGYAFSDFAFAIWDYLGLFTSNEEREEWKINFFPQNLD